VGSRGCLMRMRAPTRSGPGSRRRMDLIDGVHCGQVSTSDITAHTRSAGAVMSTVMLTLMVATSRGRLPMVQLGHRVTAVVSPPDCCSLTATRPATSPPPASSPAVGGTAPVSAGEVKTTSPAWPDQAAPWPSLWLVGGPPLPDTVPTAARRGGAGGTTRSSGGSG
jgi:hypothetical protein